MRVPADTPVPYAWPAEQLAAMVALIRRTGNEIAPGHHLRLAAPVTEDATICAFTFVTDPILGVIETPTGVVRFTYAVGVTAQELDAALSWDPTKFTGVLGDYVPLGITDPARETILSYPDARARVEAGTLEDGSSISAAHAKLLAVDGKGRIDMDTRAAQALLRAARHRLGRGRSFALVRDETWLLLGPDAPFEAGATHLQVPATRPLIDELLATFDTTPGVYRLRTVPVEIHVVGDR